jgi:subtilisin family serine protease
VEWWAFARTSPAAWDVTTGSGAVIGVIDTGIDASHPEFAGRIKATVDQDSETIDPKHDDAGHGTHVASLACANGGNGVGLAGAAYGCSLVVERSDLSDLSVAQSIVDATDRGATHQHELRDRRQPPAAHGIVDAIDYAYKRGVVLVAAAADDPIEEQGDPSNVLQPTGTGPDISKGKGLDVTAASEQDSARELRGRGTQISIAAYGTYGAATAPGRAGSSVRSPATPRAWRPARSPPATRHATAARSSTATRATPTSAERRWPRRRSPAVAAMVRHLNPDLSAADIIELIKRTARRPGGGGWNAELGWGILDAGAAITAARARTAARRRRA